MSDSDTETLYEEPTSLNSKPKLGVRGLLWLNKFTHAMEYRFKVANLKNQGKTKDEIVDAVPEYYYDEEYHDVCIGMRRIKSTTDLMGAVGTSKGYSAYEWCGERSNDNRNLYEYEAPQKWAYPKCFVA